MVHRYSCRVLSTSLKENVDSVCIGILMSIEEVARIESGKEKGKYKEQRN